MSITVTSGGETITSTEGTSAEDIHASLAALDASSKDAPPQSRDNSADAAAAPPSIEPVEPSEPAPAIAQDRNRDGTFKQGGKKDAQSRIAHVTWEREEAKRQHAAAMARAEQLEKELAEARKSREATTQPAAPEKPDGRPSEDDIGVKYQTYGDYVEALADWKLEQRWQKQQAEQQATEQQQAHAQEMQAHGKRWTTWREQNPQQAAEWDELMPTPTSGPQLSPAMISAILTSERGPAALHYLATHPEECLQLVADSHHLPPTAASWVRSVLESKLSAPAASPGPAKAVTRSPVPAPIQPVGASPVVSEVDTSTLTGRAYLEAENARELKRHKSRLGLG